MPNKRDLEDKWIKKYLYFRMKDKYKIAPIEGKQNNNENKHENYK